jgi:hypothetical protein
VGGGEKGIVNDSSHIELSETVHQPYINIHKCIKIYICGAWQTGTQ